MSLPFVQAITFSSTDANICGYSRLSRGHIGQPTCSTRWQWNNPDFLYRNQRRDNFTTKQFLCFEVPLCLLGRERPYFTAGPFATVANVSIIERRFQLFVCQFKWRYIVIDCMNWDNTLDVGLSWSCNNRRRECGLSFCISILFHYLINVWR